MHPALLERFPEPARPIILRHQGFPAWGTPDFKKLQKLMGRKYGKLDVKRFNEQVAVNEVMLKKNAESLGKLAKAQADNKIEWIPRNAHPKQQAFLDAFVNPKYKKLCFSGGNRAAKTSSGLWCCIATAIGHLPWDPSQQLFFPHKQPRRIRIVGADWENHIERVIITGLREWWPKSRKVSIHKNQLGKDAIWKDDATGSTITIMSNKSDVKMFEGEQLDLIYYDEPPSREIRVASSRGLVDREGREIFGATLINEAWVYKEVIKAKDENGLPDPQVFSINAEMYDNCSKCKDCGAYIDRFREMALCSKCNSIIGGFEFSEKKEYGNCQNCGKIEEFKEKNEYGVCPNCGPTLNYVHYGLTMDAIKTYIKNLKPHEVAARIQGLPSFMSSLIWPQLDHNLHVLKEKIPVPLDWIVDILIDFHPAKPWAVSFYAVDRRGYYYQVNELYRHGHAKEIAEEIVRICRDNHYRVAGIYIDPLAKADDQTIGIDAYQIMDNIFASFQMPFTVATKEKETGIQRVSELLITENKMPGFFWFPGLVSYQYHENWTRNEDGKPSKDESDFCENTYRYALLNRQWYPVEEEQEEERTVGRGRNEVSGY